jgi:hypothetical protein
VKPQPDTSKGMSLVLLSSPYATTNITNVFVATFLTTRHFKHSAAERGVSKPSVCNLLTKETEADESRKEP